ncbi:MAG: hypothetical protein E7652_06425 [Ruminococcaceae bacterium]|nr:hypothetical protein [Oscillospiraceae bacterium]
MITTKPYFYDSFKCTADKCRDSCCIGWEIDIDSKTYLRYKAEKGELGEKLRSNINNQSFILTKDERCPFLEKNGLCELICEKGEGYLCEICREHPRYHEWYGKYHDVGLGLCCEEACRLLFHESKPLRFITENDKSENEEEEDELILSLLSEREEIFNILSDRTLPLSKRFETILDCNVVFDEIISVLEDLEPFDKRWSESFYYIKDNYMELLSLKDKFLFHIGERVYEYESLSLYLVHRYFVKSYNAYFTDSVLRGIAVYMGAQLLFDIYTYKNRGRFDFSDRIDTAKYISKQIEYSEENIDIIMNT